ncbi:monoglyceride lipase-like [Leucoraja erinacea]|uniref:monoglyceride lipase-like n=1 Tax=Leucoraja erinaceus TaxID=7782 RepID=UPI002458BD9F|nr:monoglyceride lipase-like [Leucoraja erinacea]
MDRAVPKPSCDATQPCAFLVHLLKFRVGGRRSGRFEPYGTRDPGSILTPGIVRTEFVRSPCDRVGFLRVLRFPPSFQRCTVGHGQSEGHRLNVSHFQVYVRDCLQHIDMMKVRHPGLKIFLLAHSMGGLIAIYLMLDRPQDIAGTIHIAPLVTLNPDSAKPWKVFCTKLLCHLAPNMPVGTMDPQWMSRDENVITSFKADALSYHGAMKVGFAAVLLNAMTGLENRLPTITTPMLIMHGDADKLCNVKGSQLMYELAASTDKTLKIFEECFHQLHLELPEVVKEVYELIQSWLNERLPSTNETSQD